VHVINPFDNDPQDTIGAELDAEEARREEAKTKQNSAKAAADQRSLDERRAACKALYQACWQTIAAEMSREGSPAKDATAVDVINAVTNLMDACIDMATNPEHWSPEWVDHNRHELYRLCAGMMLKALPDGLMHTAGAMKVESEAPKAEVDEAFSD
jgi:acyl-CoA reductase-like NAD-dependent aldehyde dehydrogenase